MVSIAYDGLIYTFQAHGGISAYFTRLIEGLASLRPDWRFDVHVRHPVLAKLPQGDNIRIIARVHRTPGKLFWPYNYARRDYLLRRSRPALFHSTLSRPWLFSGVPAVCTVFDMIEANFPHLFPKRIVTERWKRQSARSARAILTISHRSAEDMVNYLGIERRRIHVTYLGADSCFRPASKDEVESARRRWALPAPYLLYVGHRGEHKNFVTLLRAFCDDRLSSFHLVAVGGQSAMTEAETLPAGVRARVRHLRNIGGEDLRLLYVAAAAFVYPSLYEGFGIPLVEAMKSGAPIVGSNIPTTREVCGDAFEPFKPLDPGDCVRAIIKASKPKRATALQRSGFERARRFSWDQCIDETLAVYERVLEATS